MTRKRIVLLTPDADSQYVANMINGVTDQATEINYQVIILTHFVNNQYEDEHNYGEENIYSLISELQPDGIIFAGSQFSKQTLLKQIESAVINMEVPAVALNYFSSIIEPCLPDDRINFQRITEHFLNVHKMRNLLCFTGPQNEHHAEERAKGFRDAMSAAGIKVRKKDIIYGDFWVNSAEKLADELISGKRKMPQAVLCGNDYMAMQLCNSLQEAGIRIPEDIAVSGYDGNNDAVFCQIDIATFANVPYKNGVDAMCCLYKMIENNCCKRVERKKCCFRAGTSCGCKPNQKELAVQNMQRFNDDFFKKLYKNSKYIARMNNICTVDEMLNIINENMYVLGPEYDFYLCLCTDWKGDFENPNEYRKNGYPQKTIVVYSTVNGVPSMERRIISTTDIIPETENGKFYFITPLHYLERNFGYCVIGTNKRNTSFPEHYSNFCFIISNALERIRISEYTKYLQVKLKSASERDFLTGLYNEKGMLANAPKDKMNYQVTLYSIINFADLQNKESAYLSFSQALRLSCSYKELQCRVKENAFVTIHLSGNTKKSDQDLKRILKQLHNLHHMEFEIEYVSFSAEYSGANDIDLSDCLHSLEEKLEKYLSVIDDKHNYYYPNILGIQSDIYADPQKKWNTAELANSLNISESHFRYLYKLLLSVNITYDIISARMALAKRLLISTTFTIEKISEQCGYDNPRYFMRIFKKRTGMTALEFRIKHTNPIDNG